MRIERSTIKSHAFWMFAVLLATTVAAAFCVARYFASEPRRWPGGSSDVGLVLGIAAGLIFIFEFLYWPRRFTRIRAWRLGRAETWLRAHLWLGILTLPLVLLHCGFQTGGEFTTVFFIVYSLVFLSGLFGLAMQQWLPRMLLIETPGETIVTQIPAILAQRVEEAERRMAQLRGSELATVGAQLEEVGPQRLIGSPRRVGTIRPKVAQQGESDYGAVDLTVLDKAWHDEIRPFLAFPARGRPWKFATPARIEEYFLDLTHRVSSAAVPLVDFLRRACDERRQFARQRQLHFWLHAWLTIHLPLSIALMLMLIVHVITSLRYSLSPY